MKILAIETSCDETAIAVVETTGTSACPKINILSNTVSSQIAIHAPFGGVVPNLAQREHQLNLLPVLKNALRAANLRFMNYDLRITNKNQSAAADKILRPRRTSLGLVNSILEREPILLEQFLQEIPKIAPPDIDAIAVTSGPGLEPALWVGINFAKALSYIWGKPLISVNHLEGHILSCLLSQKTQSQMSKIKCQKLSLPALALLVSGGHTELIKMSKVKGQRSKVKYEVIGATRDDAAGEAFDKAAKILGLGYPGGPAISREAEKWNLQFSISPASYFKFKDGRDPVKMRDNLQTNGYYRNHPALCGMPAELAKSQAPNKSQKNKIENCVIENSLKIDNCKLKITLPRPMINSKDYDFSFSGLKTSLLYKTQELGLQVTRYKLQEICREFQQAVIDVLIAKTIRAAKEYKVKTIIMGGGVVANKELRKQMSTTVKKQLKTVNFQLPTLEFTTDNAAMIGAAAALRFNREKKFTLPKNLKADGNLELR